MIHFSRGPSKYTRKWEDESAYAKQNAVAPRNPRPEDFPELGSKGDRRSKNNYQDRQEEKENKLRQNYQNDDDNRIYASRKKSQLPSRHNERRDSDRRDNSPRSRRQHDRYGPSKNFFFIFILFSHFYLQKKLFNSNIFF